ncbi:uncharacterized protein K460DRAFT_396847 [Cucurbitaria berberidis CBS 394.84]|uniref:Rhodopsin domain-containing protein n=1 Tax=Cucurbitaria berberidis CBS 394.84 TaxID=1168544 RepID=A0A9P4L6R8_9PLEO|nr:uncharacterized protein K460DRAFT_396847 [Cucurbitaria berberidis CBS 394.84]KAF1843574.1 hypothetical protein K460DRAFT_396847 [Cucurbitaria berberidis CBS 394.84]
MYLRPGFVVVIVGATLTSLSTVIVALRYYCRHFLTGSVGVSDHLMLAALMFTWANLVINYYQDITSSKFKPSYFRIPEKRPEIAATVRGTLITWWVYRMSYILALCFVKLSLLFFYRVIATHRTFRRLVYATIGFVSIYTFASCIAAAFQCLHPPDAWDTSGFFAQFDRDPNTKKPNLRCYDPVRLWVFCAAANLLSDVIILLLPIPTLLSLRVPMSKRLALIGIFSIGIMAIVASSVRMWVMMLWAESPSASARFGADLLLWGQVETNSGIISASVPFLRLLFRRREKEERGVTQRKIDMSPPKPMGGGGTSQNKPLEIEYEKNGGEGSPSWGPFITVPESLGSASRNSTLVEPTHPHMTV